MLAQHPISHHAENPGADWFGAMRRADFPAAWAINDRVLAERDPAERDDPRRPYHERWVWDGRRFDGRRVLVRCYHGLGDTLQFCRFLRPLRQRAAQLTLEVQPELIPLLRHLDGPDHLHPFDPAAPLPPSECDLEIMELAHALRLVPDPAPLLHLPPEPAAAGHVGLCWRAGNFDPGRNLPAAALRPLLGVLRPISLQRGPAAAEAGLLGAPDPLNGSMAMLPLAHLIAGLDAVVTIDTMVAHLAGLLGRPTFVLLKHDPDWRWNIEAAGEGPLGRSAWYDTVRTVRQPSPGDWDGAVARLVCEWPGTLPGRGGL